MVFSATTTGALLQFPVDDSSQSVSLWLPSDLITQPRIRIHSWAPKSECQRCRQSFIKQADRMVQRNAYRRSAWHIACHNQMQTKRRRKDASSAVL